MSRYPIKRSPIWGPLLRVMGASDSRSFLDIRSDVVIAQFGWKRIEIPRANIISVKRSNWPWWGGIGWRSDLRHSIGLIGALSPILLIRLKPQHASILGIPTKLTDLYLSVDDPEPIIQELSATETR